MSFLPRPGEPGLNGRFARARNVYASCDTTDVVGMWGGGEERRFDEVLRHPAFRGVSEAALRAWLPTLTVRVYQHGDVVGRPRTEVLRLVLEGRLCLCEWTPQGRRVILDMVEPGGTDGLEQRAGARGHFSIASLTSRVACVPFPYLERMAARVPTVRRNLLALTALSLQRRDETLERLALPTVLERLAAQMVALAEQHPENRCGDAWWRIPRMSHGDLADMLLLRRETVTLTMALLRRRGLIQVRPDEFLLDQRGLAGLRDGSPVPEPPDGTGPPEQPGPPGAGNQTVVAATAAED